jgi:hypothetical protein
MNYYPIKKTPFGEPCISIPMDEGGLEIYREAKGRFQQFIALDLISFGWILESVDPNTGIYGKHVRVSIANLVDRIKGVLPFGVTLCYGRVGPRGGKGYFLFQEDLEAI